MEINNDSYFMTDEDLKILKRAMQKVKKSKVFKELQEFKKQENKKVDVKKAA